MTLLPPHPFCLAKRSVGTLSCHYPSRKCMCQITICRVTSKCKFLMWHPHRPFWSTMSPASQCLPFMFPLDQTPTVVTRTPLFLFELTNPGLSQKPQTTLPRHPNKGCPGSCLAPCLWPTYDPLRHTVYFPQVLGVIHFSGSLSPVVYRWSMVYHSAPCAPLNKC